MEESQGSGVKPCLELCRNEKVLITTLMPACQSPAGLGRQRGGATLAIGARTGGETSDQLCQRGERRKRLPNPPLNYESYFTLRGEKNLLRKKEEEITLSVWISFKGKVSGYSRMSKLTFPSSLGAQIRSNVYNKPHHIAQPQPVFLRLAFLTFYPALEINQPG